MKLLVVYYSHDGNTRAYAERIAREKNADIMELKPVKDLKGSKGAQIMRGGFLASFGLGTRLHSAGVNPVIYENIILGTPVWAGKPSAAVNEFLNKFEVNDKIIGAFVLSGSGNGESCLDILKKKCPNIKETVSLADRVNADLYGANEEKIKEFIDKI